jgi:hypothetical protein
MLTLAQDQLARNLHETNDRLRFWLETLFPNEAPPAVATPQQMAGLLSELLRAGEWLRTGLPRAGASQAGLLQGQDPELEAELGNYRQNVERLRELLPSIQKVLLREKARLEAERAQIQSAAQWAAGSRSTL